MREPKQKWRTIRGGIGNYEVAYYDTKAERDADAQRLADLDTESVLCEVWSAEHPQDALNKGWASDATARPMPDETFEDIAEQQGWTETTCYGVLMDFIDNHADKAALIRYARERADEENDPHDDFNDLSGEDDEAVVCERHDGPWGEDETCARCTYEDGTPRPLTDKGPLGPGEEN